MDRESGRVQRLVTQIQLLQRLMVRASAEDDQAELNRLADLMVSHTVMTTRLSPWFARELVRGWMTHLPDSPDPKTQQRARSRRNEKGDRDNEKE
jgi:hypothetical protein